MTPFLSSARQTLLVLQSMALTMAIVLGLAMEDRRWMIGCVIYFVLVSVGQGAVWMAEKIASRKTDPISAIFEKQETITSLQTVEEKRLQSGG